MTPSTHPPIANANQRRVPMGHVSIRNPLQAPKERSCGISITSPSPGSAKRDLLSSSISDGMCKSPFGELIFGEGHIYPQLRCFAACSGFHDIGPALRNLQLMLNLLSSVGAWLCHANIVQRVKTCYKIKIDSRDLDCCFYGVLLCKQHPRHTIAPLLHSNSATIRQ